MNEAALNNTSPEWAMTGRYKKREKENQTKTYQLENLRNDEAVYLHRKNLLKEHVLIRSK